MTNLGWMAVVMVMVMVTAMAGCASAGAGRVGSLSAERGAVVVPGTSTKAIVLGPKVIHAFASGSGAGLYSVPASDNVDRDCAAALRRDIGGGVSMARDRRVVFSVAAGEVVCLATSGKRDFELLWHAIGETTTEAENARVAMVKARR